MTAAHAMASHRAAVGIRLATLADVPPGDAWLAAEERATLARLRVPKRHGEWRLGRWVAKHSVMAWLGLGPSNGVLTSIVLRPDPHGAPDVLVDGVPGLVAVTLSHRAGWALAAVGLPAAALGCDLELIEPRSPAFVHDFFTADERRRVLAAPERDRPRVATLTWSVKESALKALRTGLRRDTRSVEVTFDAAAPEAEDWSPVVVRVVEDQRMLHGWSRVRGDRLVTVIADPPAPPPASLKASMDELFA